MELVLRPDFEDHLQPTTFISCTALSDAKDGTSGSDIAYDVTLGKKEEDWLHEQDEHRHDLYHSKYLYVIHGVSDY